ncbi:sensor histidine kinase [Sphingomonas oryzagri]
MCDETPRSVTLNREAVHDLRNLFGIVQSASRLLETTTDADRRGLLLSAIAGAADRGATVSRLLLRTPWPDIRCFDLNDRLRAMQPMLAALAAGPSRFTLDLAPQAIPLRADLDDFEASLIELVTNGCAAHDGGSRITIRTRVHDDKIWLMVVDGEQLFDPAVMRGAWRGLSTNSGIGLSRVTRFAGSTSGRFRLWRSHPHGAAAVLILPLAAATSAPPRQSISKENDDEKERWTAAA